MSRASSQTRSHQPISFEMRRDYSKIKAKGKISEMLTDFHLHGRNRYMKINQPANSGVSSARSFYENRAYNHSSTRSISNNRKGFKNPLLNRYEDLGEEEYERKQYVFEYHEEDRDSSRRKKRNRDRSKKKRQANGGLEEADDSGDDGGGGGGGGRARRHNNDNSIDRGGPDRRKKDNTNSSIDRGGGGGGGDKRGKDNKHDTSIDRGGGGGDRRGKDQKHDNSMDKGGAGERRGKERTKETTSLSKKSDKEVDERKVDETVKQIEKFVKSKSNASGNMNGDGNGEFKKNRSKSDLKKNGRIGAGENELIRNGYESDLDHSPNGDVKRNRRRKKKENGEVNGDGDTDLNASRNRTKKKNGSFINGNGTTDYDSTGAGYDSNAENGKKHRTRTETNSLTGKEYEDLIAREGSKLSMNSSRKLDNGGAESPSQKSSRSSRKNRDEKNGSKLENANENPSEEQKEDLFREKNIVVNKAVDDIDDPDSLAKRPVKKKYNSTNKDVEDENGDGDVITSPRNRQPTNPTPRKTLKESSTQTPRDVSFLLIKLNKRYD